MGLRDQNNRKKIGISGPRIYHVTTLDFVSSSYMTVFRLGNLA